MTIAYWVTAALLGIFYSYAGGKKVVQSRTQLAPMMGWVDTVPMPAVRLIGTVELLGVVGLLLPPLTGIAPALAIAAAVGFVILQVAAIGLQLQRGEGHRPQRRSNRPMIRRTRPSCTRPSRW